MCIENENGLALIQFGKSFVDEDNELFIEMFSTLDKTRDH